MVYDALIVKQVRSGGGLFEVRQHLGQDALLWLSAHDTFDYLAALEQHQSRNADDCIAAGHGGVLDRTDSLVLPVVFIYYYAKLTVG